MAIIIGEVSPRPGMESESPLRAAGAKWGPGVPGQRAQQRLAAHPGLCERHWEMQLSSELDKGRGSLGNHGGRQQGSRGSGV